MIEVTDLSKVYTMGTTQVHALREVSLSIRAGEYVAIVGASGSGKSTLMNIIGLLDFPTAGSYRIRGTEAAHLSKRDQADLRNREIGFVFQRFNLLARASAQRQVELPLFYANVPASKARAAATESLQRVGLGDRTHHRPDELSGGQQQRVAIARALVNKPGLILADEPTGALDSRTGQEILALFDELNQQGITLVVVTHDHGVAAHAHRTITLSDGQIIEDKANGRSKGKAMAALPLNGAAHGSRHENGHSENGHSENGHSENGQAHDVASAYLSDSVEQTANGAAQVSGAAQVNTTVEVGHEVS